MLATENETWKQFLNEGKQFFKTASNGVGKPEKFTPDILYNIVSMSIEKYIMAFLMKSKNLPFNHTLQDLLDGIKKVTNVDRDLEERLIHLNSFQEICSVDQYSRKSPSNEDIEYMVTTAKIVANFIEKKLQ